MGGSIVMIQTYKSEDELQIVCIEYMRFKYPDALVYHVPNESDSKPQYRKKLKAKGVLAGVSDIIIQEPRGGYSGFAAELKIEYKDGRKNKMSEAQEAFFVKARLAGMRAEVFYDLDDFMRDLDEYMSKPRTKMI